MPSSKTVRKGYSSNVFLRDEVNRVLKMHRGKFVAYMMKNNTRKELIELILQFHKSLFKNRPMPVGSTQKVEMIYKSKTKVELCTSIYELLNPQRSIFSQTALKYFGLVNDPDVPSSKEIKCFKTAFQHHLHNKIQRSIAGKTNMHEWMQALRNYFQKSNPAKSPSTKKAARK